jgi:apolipoprotein N-acyltransferase
MIGERGITFLVMLVNSFIAGYIILREKKYLSVVVIISTVLLICFFHSDTAIPNGKRIKVALIQGNVHADWGWRIKNPVKIFNTYKKLSLEAAKSGPDLIVWPEYAIPDDITTNKDLYSDISDLAKQTGAYIVFGSLEKTERTDSRYRYIRDVAHIFARNGDHRGTYASVIPFPYEGNIVPGSEYPVFSTELGKFGIVICWEEYHEFINKKYRDLGANFFIHMVNDAPIRDWNTMKTRVRRSRFRASQNNRYVIRAANSGITEVVNPYGKVTAALEPNKEGFLIADIYLE